MSTRLALTLTLLASSCTVLRVDSDSRPARIESTGLIHSHVAVGIPSESHLLHMDLFDGTSDGAIGELTIWKLFHLEVGLAGLSVGVGPLHLGLGVLFYEPEVPPTMHRRAERKTRDEERDDEDESAEEDVEASSSSGD